MGDERGADRLHGWDRFEHIGDPGPQPTVNRDGSERGQFHARRNLSTLLVLRRMKTATPQLDLDDGEVTDGK